VIDDGVPIGDSLQLASVVFTVSGRRFEQRIVLWRLVEERVVAGSSGRHFHGDCVAGSQNPKTRHCTFVPFQLVPSLLRNSPNDLFVYFSGLVTFWKYGVAQ